MKNTIVLVISQEKIIISTSLKSDEGDTGFCGGVVCILCTFHILVRL